MNSLIKLQQNQLPYQGKLTLSAGVITDTVRLAGVEGDGGDVGDGVGVWPAAMNLVTNGGFETNTTGWVRKSVDETLARVTTTSKFGSACAQITLAGVQSYEGLAGDQNLALVNGTVYTAGAWVWCESGTLNLRIRIINSASVPIATTNFVATTTPQRVSVTVTATAGTPFEVEVLANGAQTGKFWVDGVSCYASAIDMPYIETDGGTASRVAGTITMPASVLDETQMWVAFRAKMGFGTASPPSATLMPFAWRDSANEGLLMYYIGGAGLYVRRDSGGTGFAVTVSPSWSLGDDVVFVAAYTASLVRVSTAGSAFTEAANITIPTISSSAYISNDPVNAGRQIYSSIRWAAIGIGPLANADAALFNSWCNNRPLPHMFPQSVDVRFLAHFYGDGTQYRWSAA